MTNGCDDCMAAPHPPSFFLFSKKRHKSGFAASFLFSCGSVIALI
jgi:hypothetical protein